MEKRNRDLLVIGLLIAITILLAMMYAKLSLGVDVIYIGRQPNPRFYPSIIDVPKIIQLPSLH